LVRHGGADTHDGPASLLRSLDAAQGFTLVFSQAGAVSQDNQYRSWIWRPPRGAAGNWYDAADVDMEGWLCPCVASVLSEGGRKQTISPKKPKSEVLTGSGRSPGMIRPALMASIALPQPNCVCRLRVESVTTEGSIAIIHEITQHQKRPKGIVFGVSLEKKSNSERLSREIEGARPSRPACWPGKTCGAPRPCGQKPCQVDGVEQRPSGAVEQPSPWQTSARRRPPPAILKGSDVDAGVEFGSGPPEGTRQPRLGLKHCKRRSEKARKRA